MKEVKKIRNYILSMTLFGMGGLLLFKKQYTDIGVIFAYVLIFVSIKTIIDFYLGLTIRVGYSGEVENVPKFKGIRFFRNYSPPSESISPASAI